MTFPGRIPCLNPACRRTAAADGNSDRIVCGKCWRLLPVPLRDEWKRFKAHDRRMRRLVDRRIRERSISVDTVQRIGNLQIKRHDDIWRRIEACFKTPEAPLGLDGFLREVGL
jgi:hypothetical protein